MPVSDGEGTQDTAVMFTKLFAPVDEQVNCSTHVVASNKMLTVSIVVPTWNDPENVLPAFDNVTVAGHPTHPVYIVSVMVFG